MFLRRRLCSYSMNGGILCWCVLNILTCFLYAGYLGITYQLNAVFYRIFDKGIRHPKGTHDTGSPAKQRPLRFGRKVRLFRQGLFPIPNLKLRHAVCDAPFIELFNFLHIFIGESNN